MVRPPSWTSPAAAAPPRRLPIGSLHVCFRVRGRPVAPATKGPLCPNASSLQLAELASLGESQSRESLSYTSPSSECTSSQASREGRLHLEPMDPEPAAASTLGWRGTDSPASGNPEILPGPLILSLVCCVCLSGFVSFGARAIAEVPANSHNPEI